MPSAKERLLAPDAPDQTTVTLLGSGARLVGGARSAELARDEVSAMVVEGFFPEVAIDERPHGRRSGIVEFGLPYAPDAAVTRHLAAFLGQHARVSREALAEQAPDPDGTPVPDAVLLNGGVFQSETLTRRARTDRGLAGLGPGAAAQRRSCAGGRPWGGCLCHGQAGQKPAHRRWLGAQLFSGRRDEGAQRQGVCLLPRGSEEGREVRLKERTFSLRLGEPVSFHLASSTGDHRIGPGT